MAGKFELKQAKNEEFYFNLLNEDGKVILTSEMYKTKASAENGIESVQKNAPDDARYERLTSANGKPYFVLKAGNHQIIGQSQMYDSEDKRELSIEQAKQLAAAAAVDVLIG